MVSAFRNTVLLVALVLAWLTPVAAQEKPFIVAVDDAYPPYMFGTTPAKGLYSEIIRAAFLQVGIQAKVIGLPRKRALNRGREGTVAIGGIYQNLERMQIYDYSDPLFTESLVVCVKKGHRFPFSGMAHFKGKRLGINRGWSYGEVFDGARRAGLFIAEEAANNEANLKKLLASRVDCIVVDEISLLHILDRTGWGDEIETLDVPAAVNSSHLVFAKHKQQTHVLDKFNQGLVKIKENGTYYRLLKSFIRGVAAD